MRFMNRISMMILVGLALGFNSCHTNNQELLNTPGVSIKLAEHRKAILRNIAYTITLDIPAEIKKPIYASELLTFTLSDIEYPLEIDFSEKSDLLKSIKVNGLTSKIIHKNEHIILNQELLINGNNKIEIQFIAGETNLNRKEEFLYSLLVPDQARSFIPCFDQPDLKSIFTVTAKVPSDWEAISNGTIKDTLTVGNTKTYKFNTSDTISTYLFSIVAGKFNRISRIIDKKEVNFYYRETDTVKINKSIDSIFELHRSAIHFMEDFTGIQYPFQKFDFIAIPDFPYDGMEHVGAIDYKASVLFLDSSNTKNEELDRARVIAHETAHMWFGNLVTMKWFSDVWLKEVFANFMADKILNTTIPDTNEDSKFLLAHHPYAYYVDRTEGANAIRQNLENLNQAGTLYGNIIYHKAPIVFKQLEKNTGEHILKHGLKKYLRTYQFGNADWADLIAILDKISSDDLSEWNEQWINTIGRPILTYEMNTKENVIKNLTISQKGEHGISGIWKQYFTIALVYMDSIKIIPIHMNDYTVNVREVGGLAPPLFVLFNATGEGYGLFPIDVNMIPQLSKLKKPVMRASAYINIYENTLNAQAISPNEFLGLYGMNFNKENNIQIIERMVAQCQNIYWQFTLPLNRIHMNQDLEAKLWYAIDNTSSGDKKRILFQLYTRVAQSTVAISRLYQIWKTKIPPPGIHLNEDDYVLLASELVIRKHQQDQSIINEQMARIKDNTRKSRFKFTLSALSNDMIVRDTFFSSLSLKTNRANKDWVLISLRYLHHPLRLQESEKYLPKTLQLLKEIQETGDIFFPSQWLQTSLNYYQSEKAANIVRSFLRDNPEYNKNLKGKILQESDDLFRSRKILYSAN
jgi:aminopeptidase N